MRSPRASTCYATAACCVPSRAAGRSQEASLAEVQLKLGDLRGLIAARVKHLPYSARRLAALAAVAGSRFEAGLIAAAAEEHPVVCDVAFDIMLQRWLIRRSPERWYHRTRPQRETDREPTTFEFSSESIWRAIYADIQTTRRRLMHREVAETLEREHAADPLAVCESLAYHFRAASLHQLAITYLGRRRQSRALWRHRDRAALLRSRGRGDRRRDPTLPATEKSRLERERERLRADREKLSRRRVARLASRSAANMRGEPGDQGNVLNRMLSRRGPPRSPRSRRCGPSTPAGDRGTGDGSAGRHQVGDAAHRLHRLRGLRGGRLTLGRALARSVHAPAASPRRRDAEPARAVEVGRDREIAPAEGSPPNHSRSPSVCSSQPRCLALCRRPSPSGCARSPVARLK